MLAPATRGKSPAHGLRSVSLPASRQGPPAPASSQPIGWESASPPASSAPLAASPAPHGAAHRGQGLQLAEKAPPTANPKRPRPPRRPSGCSPKNRSQCSARKTIKGKSKRNNKSKGPRLRGARCCRTGRRPARKKRAKRPGVPWKERPRLLHRAPARQGRPTPAPLHSPTLLHL